MTVEHVGIQPGGDVQLGYARTWELLEELCARYELARANGQPLDLNHRTVEEEP